MSGVCERDRAEGDESGYLWIRPQDGEYHIAEKVSPDTFVTVCVHVDRVERDDLSDVNSLGERNLFYDVCMTCRAALMRENDLPTFRAVPPEGSD